MDDLERQSVVADLICWDAEHLALFESALKDHGLDVKSSALIPLQTGGDGQWGSLEQSYTWPHPTLTFLTTDRLSQVSAPLVSERLGATRITRLQELHRIVMQCDMTPDDELVAEWAEAVARALLSTRLKLATWNAFYLDLAAVFAGRKATSLRGRRVLLDQKGTLRRAVPWDDQEDAARDPTVFVPPQRLGETAPDDADDVAADEEEVAVPVGLQRVICYLHDGLALRRREGSTTIRTPILELLEETGSSSGSTVTPSWRTYAVCSAVVWAPRRSSKRFAGSTYKTVSQAGLRGLENIGLHVPTCGDWIRATDAVFSGGWRRRTGSTLTSLVEAVGEASGTMTAYASRILLDPDDWPFRVDTDGFGDFLQRIGVRDGLHPIALRSNARIQMEGRHFHPEDIARRFGLDEKTSEISGCTRSRWSGPPTPRSLVHIPQPRRSRALEEYFQGRDTYGDFSPRARDLLAGLVIQSVERGHPRPATTPSNGSCRRTSLKNQPQSGPRLQ